MIRNIAVDTDRAALVATGAVEPVREWVEKDGRRQPSDDQSRDEATGALLWQVHCLAVGEDRPEVVAVRVPAPDCPAPAAFSPVRFERLIVRVNVNRTTGQLGGYWSAAGIAAEQHGRRDKQDVVAA